MNKLLATLAMFGATATATAAPLGVIWGEPGDVPVPRDFDADGRADYVVWRPSTGTWYVRGSTTAYQQSAQWGQAGDIPVPGDYDGDKRADYIVWRPSNGTWYVRSGTTGAYLRAQQWGLAGDIPRPADYDGDGRLDFAVFRPSAGTWYVMFATTAMRSIRWGENGDIPIVGPHDDAPGDDYGVFRPSTGEWWTLGGVTGLGSATVQWGTAGDAPTTARFCSDTISKTVWRWWESGSWHTRGQPAAQLGQQGDIPVPANFLGDSVDERAVWRPSTGTWLVEPSTCDRWEPARARVARATQHVRGITVAAVKNGQIVFSSGAGYANLTVPATPDVPFQIASISKLFIGTAVLMQHEAGKINLDATAGSINPHNGQAPTVRHHARHTSGTLTNICYSVGNFEPSTDLAQQMTCLYNANAWAARLPGTESQYSNIGAAYPARVVETSSGIDFDLFTRIRIFIPLQMFSTAWFRGQLGTRPISDGFHDNGALTGETGVLPYPMGNLRASVLDLARFMVLWTSGGTAFGTRLLRADTVDMALTVPTDAIGPVGFYWFRGATKSGRTVWGHNGILTGVCTRMNIDPLTHEGVVVLTNGSCNKVNGDIDEIEDRVFRTLQEL